MVLLPAAVLRLPAYQCLVRVDSAEQAQSRQAARALAWWFRHGRSQLGRCGGPPCFVAQLELGVGSAIEREVWRRTGMQRQVPVARKSAVRLVAMLLRVTAVPVAATWVILARMTASPVKARLVKPPPVTLTRTRAAPTRVPPGVPRSRVERPQAKAPPSACRAGP